MSSKQLVSPRKPKKRPYRRRIRNKKNNHTGNDNNNKLTNISTNDKLKPMKLHSNDSNTNNIPMIAHSRTLSYVNNNNNKSNTNRNRNNNNNNSHSRINSPLSPIQIENELLTSPRTNNNNNNNNIKPNNNNNFLSFNTCNSQTLSVSLPSSPINRRNNSNNKFKNNIKNKRFNTEIVNKLQRVSSMNSINIRNTPITRIKTIKKTKPLPIIKNECVNSENISVMIRFRPFDKRELAYSMTSDEIQFSNKNKKISLNYYGNNNNRKEKEIRSYSFKFDKIFNKNTTQKTIFKFIAKPICDDLLQFKSNYGTIFCYGQSGSGKTYTMTGPQRPVKKRANSSIIHRRCRSERLLSLSTSSDCTLAVCDIEEMGIIGRSCCYIFDELSDLKESLYNVYTEFTYNIYIECIEIYNEKLKDLLNSKNIPIIREIKNRKKNQLPYFKTEIQNITRKHVKSIKEILNILSIASLNRNIHKTSLNEQSSRSHMMIRLIIKTNNYSDNKKTESILNFIDLAGSENIKKTKNNKKKQVVEAGNILKSLTTLSQVIDSLIKNKKHIPYKDSKLTRVLQNSLGGNCKTSLLICASQHIYNRYETIRSLKFGLRCQQIKNYIKYNDEICTNSTNQKHINNKNNKKKPSLKLNGSKSLTLSLQKENKSVELEDKPLTLIADNSVIIKEDNNTDLMKQIEKLNIENDLLKTKDELNDNVNILNETISKIALQNLFKKNTKKIKKKKNKKGYNNGNVENELNIFESKLIQITIGLNAKIDKIKQLIDDGLNMCEDINIDNNNNNNNNNNIDGEDNDEIIILDDTKRDSNSKQLLCDNEGDNNNDNNNDTIGNDKDNKLVMIKHKPNTNNLINSINFNQKIYSETMVQQLKQQNEELMQEINRLKSATNSGTPSVSNATLEYKLVKTPRESNSTNFAEYHRTPTLDFDCDENEQNDTYYICDDDDIYHNIYDDDDHNNNNNNNNKPKQQNENDNNNNKCEQTLSEQLNIMDKMRSIDKNNWDLVQSPLMENTKFDSSSHRISPRDSITLLKNTKLLPSNSNTNNNSNTSSARSSINSQSVLSTTIESIDEHLEKWNSHINGSRHRLSTMDIYNNRRRSSANTAISISLSSTNTNNSDNNNGGDGAITPTTLDLEQSVTTYNEMDFDDKDSILKEENEETEIDEEESLSDEPYDCYSETDDDQNYYNNSFNGGFQRTKTDSQIFRSIGMELSKKLKAKSVESPCQNNQRLSSTFAIHWINLKNIK